MNNAVVRNGAMISGIVLAGLVCSRAAPYLVSPRGALGPTVLQAESPGKAAFAVLLCLGISTLIAIGVARIVNTAVGIFAIGAGLFVLASRLATIFELAFSTGASRRSLWLIPIETLLWGAICYAAVAAVFRFGGPLPDVHPDEPPADDMLTKYIRRRPSLEQRAFVKSAVWLISHLPVRGQAPKIATAALLMLPLVWVIAQSSMKGQMLASTFFGALMVGLVGRLVAPNTQPVFLFVAPIVVGAFGHVVGLSLLHAPLDQALVSRMVPNLALPMPIDYAAGSLMGVAVGLGWARSFLHHEESAQAVESR